MAEKILYDETVEFDNDEYFEDLFNNGYANHLYVVGGIIGLWDGKRKGYSTKVFNSIYDAIIACNDGFDGYIRVSEKNYGRLYVHINHHDGNNYLEIRELTRKGEEMHNNYCDVGDILERKGATRNVKFSKRFY